MTIVLNKFKIIRLFVLDELETREFSFTLQRDNSETYIRYLSFSNQNELEKEVLRFCPYKIDIGAIYNLPVSIKYINIILNFIK